jgi:hypothetical protein
MVTCANLLDETLYRMFLNYVLSITRDIMDIIVTYKVQ